jgi:hypothetical protein
VVELKVAALWPVTLAAVAAATAAWALGWPPARLYRAAARSAPVLVVWAVAAALRCRAWRALALAPVDLWRQATGLLAHGRVLPAVLLTAPLGVPAGLAAVTAATHGRTKQRPAPALSARPHVKAKGQPKRSRLSGLGEDCAHPTPGPHCGVARNPSNTRRFDGTRPTRATPASPRAPSPAAAGRPARAPATTRAWSTPGRRTPRTAETTREPARSSPQPDSRPQSNGGLGGGHKRKRGIRRKS